MSNKKLYIIIFIIIVIAIIMPFVPFERWIFRFNTAEEALKFDYTQRVEKVISTLEHDDFAYITYVNKSGTLQGRYVEKDNRGWISPIKKMILSNGLKLTSEYRIRSYPENNKNLIIISDGSKEKERLVQNVSDSIGTEFIENSYEYDGVYHKNWMGIIDKYPEDYKIYLDEEVVEF